MTPMLIDDMRVLLETDTATLDGRLEGDETALAAILEGVATRCHRAYACGDVADEFIVNQLLHAVYRLHTTLPPPSTPTAEGSWAMERVRNLLEDAFLEHEESLLPPSALTDLPAGPDEYRDWLYGRIAEHRVSHHPLFTQFLPHQATAEDLRYFLIQESTIDANTDDFLALCQVGVRSTAKIEIAANYWDEMGNGDQDLLHATLFERAADSLGITAFELEQALELEALICGNLQVMLSLRRKHFYKAIGYFAVVEYMTPDRFANLLACWTRNGLDEAAAAYHRVHISVDVEHADRWFRSVITPVLVQHPDAVEEITRGALYRLNTSERYLDRVYPKLPSRREDH